MSDERKSLAMRLREAGITMSTGGAKRTTDEDGWEHDAYRVELRNRDRRMRVPFRKGTGHMGSPPQLEEVLESLLSDASTYENADGFENWARDLGYDEDSRKAEKIYRAVEVQTAKLRDFLGDDYEAFLWETDYS